jgi:hypothetical protein
VTTTCGIFINSSASDAFHTNGGVSITATQILVNGGTSLAANSSVTPTPVTNAGTVSDPLSSLSMPSFDDDCDNNNYKLNGGANATLSPGTYCGGITVQSSSTATFSPGLYIINGGGLNISSSSTATGTGVTFFITGQYGQSAAPVDIQGGAMVTFSAPSSGPRQGMLFIQDRNLTYSTSNIFNGNAASVMSGTLYFPTTTVTYSGTSTTGSYTAVVTKKMQFNGNANFKNDPTGTYTGLASTVRGLIQ